MKWAGEMHCFPFSSTPVTVLTLFAYVCVEKDMLQNTGLHFSFLQMLVTNEKEEMFLQGGGLGLIGHHANSPTWTFKKLGCVTALMD